MWIKCKIVLHYKCYSQLQYDILGAGVLISSILYSVVTREQLTVTVRYPLHYTRAIQAAQMRSLAGLDWSGSAPSAAATSPV